MPYFVNRNEDSYLDNISADLKVKQVDGTHETLLKVPTVQIIVDQLKAMHILG